jgi:DNA-binding LacI/PurR family transcriptional regulator
MILLESGNRYVNVCSKQLRRSATSRVSWHAAPPRQDGNDRYDHSRRYESLLHERGAEDVAFSRGYRLILCNTDNDHAKELAHLNALRTYLPAGLLVIPSTFSDIATQTASYRKAGTTVVCVDRLPRHWDGYSVTVANEEGAYHATRFLIQMKYRQIAMITGQLHLTNARGAPKWIPACNA